MADLPYLTTFFADWNAAGITGDTWDPGFGPDAFRPWCDVQFTPVLIGQDSQEISITAQTPKLTLLLLPVAARLESGVLKAVRTAAPIQETPTAGEWEEQEESIGVPLTAETAALELPPGVHLIYRVTFGPMKIQGGTYTFDGFDFAAPTSSTRVHLTTVERINLPPSNDDQLVLRMIPDDVTLVGPSLIQFWSNGIALGEPLAVEISDDGGGGSFTWGTIPGKPDVVAAGATADAARGVIGAVSGSELTNAIAAAAGNLQPSDPDLTSIASLPSTSNRMLYSTGPNTWALTELTPYGRSVAALADAPALRVLAGLIIGTNVQAYATALASLVTAVNAAAAGARSFYTSDNGATWQNFRTQTFGRSLADTVDAPAARTLLGALSAAMVGAADGVAPLDSNSLIPSVYLPSYVDDVIEAANFAALTGGVSGKIYTTLDNGKIYRWSGSAFVEISASPGSTDAVPEGAANLYYTNARADARIAAAASTGTGSIVRANSPAFSGTPTGITKSHVGLSAVDNVSDINKPVSTAQAAADTAVANASVAKALVDAKGDLFTGTADNTVGRLAVGTNGQVLTADSTQAGGMKWAAPASGGGGAGSGYGTYAAMPVANTVADGYIYHCSDIDAVYRSTGAAWDLVHIAGGVGGVEPASTGWSWVNQGAATVAADKGGRLLTIPSAAANMRMEVRALVSAINYTATCYVDSAIYSADSSYVGMILRNSTSGNFVLFMCGYEASSGGTTLASVKWSSPSTGVADYRKQGPGLLANGAPRWLRVRDNGTTRFLEYSYNGVDWLEHHSIGRTDYLTPDQVGWGGYNQNGKITTARLRSWNVA